MANSGSLITSDATLIKPNHWRDGSDRRSGRPPPSCRILARDPAHGGRVPRAGPPLTRAETSWRPGLVHWSQPIGVPPPKAEYNAGWLQQIAGAIGFAPLSPSGRSRVGYRRYRMRQPAL